MKASSSVSLLLGVMLSGLTVSAVFVDVSPNRHQFLRGESVSLRCAGGPVSAGWRLKRADGCRGQTQSCDEDLQDFGTFAGSSCIVSDLSPAADDRIYWCEDRAGTESGHVQIHVSDHVILEIPTLPVMTGDDVTLRCRSRYEVLSIRRERVIGEKKKIDDLPPVFTISSVQPSDEGVYRCSAQDYDMVMMSRESRLTVRGQDNSNIVMKTV
ncbi:uncharacterized protein LOC120557130 [Perca fluviatilis]|uniref:uncharacterized protein LOC120557130 n=1 Tax=Perca fluviatilis TaxID=8168 RepID=UPI001964B9FA|nr:uncharacterized protein LOC120557130 [Perca fluviatilis]